MTEPDPGPGSGRAPLTTRAVRSPGGWKFSGHKHFITGADGADFFIVFARTSGNPGDPGGATMLLASAASRGVRVGRHITTLDRSVIGAHCEVAFDHAFIPNDAVLGEVDAGFEYAQLRLGPHDACHAVAVGLPGEHMTLRCNTC